ncbi:MAG: glucan biosynthesis protein [Hyphomicrobiaceae bacterium]
MQRKKQTLARAKSNNLTTLDLAFLDRGPKSTKIARRDVLAFVRAMAITAASKRAGQAGLLGGLALIADAGTPVANADTGASEGKVFGSDTVRELAKALSGKPFKLPTLKLPPPLQKLTYDQYRDIRFAADKAVWRGEMLGFELQLLSLGFLYDVPVEIGLVEDGKVRALTANSELFNFGPLVGPVATDATLGFSGFRIHGPINKQSYLDEYAVFQGASYFRLLARGQVYGLSARGLAINTARPGGEEFPFFRAFWIEKPKANARAIVVHALLDSKSLTGAYTFSISPGAPTSMDIEATLYPRRDVPHFGVAPLTSMYLLGSAHHRLGQDFRPSVHDSEGLVIVNRAGEQIWRPLTNPKTLQVSDFVDNGPRAFGLAQRDRRFENFEDLEARYERRPTAWIEPKGHWGKGFVELIEIPTQEEIHDNVVAYWRPSGGLIASRPFHMAYRLNWGRELVQASQPTAKVIKTRVGGGPSQGTYRFVVDFSAEGLNVSNSLPKPEISASGAKISKPVVRRNPAIKGVRIAFVLDPGKADVVELRLSLKKNTQTISEVWLYRWTRS